MLITENTFVISDTHFADRTGFSDGFSLMLLANWNRTVSKDDTVLHLGDFVTDGYGNEPARKIERYAKSLNGRIVLLKGNHDNAEPRVYRACGIELIDNVVADLTGKPIDAGTCSAVTGTLKGKKVLFSHYPVIDLYSHFQAGHREKHLPWETEFDYYTGYLYNLFKDGGFDVNVHGHIHENIRHDFKNLVNVSVDNTGFVPVRIKDILEWRLCEQSKLS